MYLQKQVGQSCYYVAVCNALDIEVNREQERFYNFCLHAGFLDSAATLVEMVAKRKLPPVFTEIGQIGSDLPPQMIPKTGKGVLIVKSSHGDGHALSYQNGMVFDSGDPPFYPITYSSWEDWCRNHEFTFPNPQILKVIPLDKEENK